MRIDANPQHELLIQASAEDLAVVGGPGAVQHGPALGIAGPQGVRLRAGRFVGVGWCSLVRTWAGGGLRRRGGRGGCLVFFLVWTIDVELLFVFVVRA